MTDGRPILTAADMAAAEQRAIGAGTSVEQLMERAGTALAEAAFRFAGPRPALVLAGPGNNGGDGYVAAQHLAARGVPVRIAALAEPRTEAARAARHSHWQGRVEALRPDTEPAPLLIDALFGTGLKRGLEAAASEQLARLCAAAVASVACDLPSGVDSDSGAELSPVPDFDLTVTFGALKPAHRLMPAMRRCGRVVLADIGIAATGGWHEIARPDLPPLDPMGHKYGRGMVHCVAGAMPGAIALAAAAAARAGAGYVRIEARQIIANVPAAVVQGQPGGCDDERIGAVLIGPGLGRDGGGLLDRALASGRPLVLDGDALRLVGDPGRLRGLDAILTPHEGEFGQLFAGLAGTKAERALAAARASGATIVFKGPDTLVASPDGRLGFAPPAPAWLATAGTGDVLAGIAAAMQARGLTAFEAASAAVWVHGRAGEIAGPRMIADDLVAAIPAVP
ncbi:MAG TPA: NAD(P)H-hydrate dehydratase [Sphingomicrobium sp.]|nr:NAD(P)H-hydrate dehydratase [Sphingomicrobium sp.]